MIFIDGDHSYEAAKADYENTAALWPKTRKLFHDANCDGVSKLLQELDAKGCEIAYFNSNESTGSHHGFALLNPDTIT